MPDDGATDSILNTLVANQPAARLVKAASKPQRLAVSYRLVTMSPVSKKLINLTKWFWATGNDLCLGIRTVHYGPLRHADISFGQTKYNDGTVYQTVDYWNIRRAIYRFAPSQADVFYDVGCGMGRIVCSAARFRMRRVVGIEIDPALCQIARRNAEHLRGRNSPIEIRCEDAVATDMSDGTAYFMFNPFGHRTMQAVLENISNSLRQNSRRILITYFNPKCADLLDSCNWLVRAHEFKTLTGAAVLSWRTPTTKAAASYWRAEAL